MEKKGKRKDKDFYRGETTISIRFHFALIFETLVLFTLLISDVCFDS